MKTFTAALLSMFLVTGGMTAAMAQSTTADPAAKPAAPAAPAPAEKAPDVKVGGDAKIETKTESRTDSTDVRGSVKTDDSGSALPRSSAVERTTIFGLSPTAAVIIAAALLLVVILAIVAMTRSGDTYIDTNRRV
jgi:hypothetical protein